MNFFYSTTLVEKLKTNSISICYVLSLILLASMMMIQQKKQSFSSIYVGQHYQLSLEAAARLPQIITEYFLSISKLMMKK